MTTAERREEVLDNFKIGERSLRQILDECPVEFPFDWFWDRFVRLLNSNNPRVKVGALILWNLPEAITAFARFHAQGYIRVPAGTRIRLAREDYGWAVHFTECMLDPEYKLEERPNPENELAGVWEMISSNGDLDEGRPMWGLDD